MIDNGSEENTIDDMLFNFYTSFDYPITSEEIVNIKINNVPLDNILLNNSITNNMFSNNSFNFMNYNFTNNIPVNNNPETITDVEEEDEEEEDEEEVDIFSDLLTNNNQDNSINNIEMNNNVFGEFPNLVQFDSTQSMSLLDALLVLMNSNTLQLNNNSLSLSDVVVTTNEKDLNEMKEIVVSETIGDKCSICMIDIMKDDIILDIKCKHLFHKECLSIYLSKYNHICPVCRQDIGNSNANI